MSPDPTTNATPSSGAREPLLKRVLENPWLLLALGIGVPTLSYTVWGLVELLLIGEAKLG